MMNQFHFLHPLWLLSLIPLAGLLWMLYQQRSGNSNWSKIIDANLLPLLLKGSENKTNHFGLLLLAFAWFVSVIALADPVWEKIPRPIFQTNAARVIVLDLSRSMMIPDLKPSRLARARFKIEDILARNEEGQTGLVVFAGAGFTAAPLTRDSDTLRSLLQVLKPNIMPSQGSRADLGLLKAQELLQQAGITKGEVLLIADGVVDKLAEVAAKKLHDNGYTVSVLAVGTEAGGLIPQMPRKTTVVKLDAIALQAVAQQGGGRYQLISNNTDDLQQLLSPLNANATQENDDAQKTIADVENQDWKSNAPLLILLLLPLAAFAFRRGWLFNIILVIGLLGLSSQPQTVYANTADKIPVNTSKNASSFKDSISKVWTNLWHRQDQQADTALQQQDYQQALELSKNPLRRGSAEYKQGNYEQALKSFSEATGADADYNRGNTLAKLEKYPEAIKAYKKALEQNKNHADAKANKATLEKIIKEQKQQNKNDKKQDQKDDKKQSGDKKGDKEKSQKNSDKKEDEQQNADNKSQGKEGEKGDKDEGKNKKKGEQQGEKGEDNQFSDASEQLKNDKSGGKDNKEEQLDKDDMDKKNTQEKSAEKENGADNKNAQKQADEKNQKNNAKKPNETNSQQIGGTKAEAEALTKEEKIAAEQWLRRIPDDPGGLLRRKFTRQYRRSTPQRRGPANNTNFW